MHRSNPPGLSVVIPCHARPEIALSLAENAPILNEIGAEVILVTSGPKPPKAKMNVLPERLRYISVASSNFNKSRSLNIGLYHARSAYILILDADILLSRAFIHESLATLDGASFCSVRWVIETQPHQLLEQTVKLFKEAIEKVDDLTVEREVTIKMSFGSGRTISQVVHRENLLNGARGGPGIILAERSHLLAIGGYNSNAPCWGWEDNDVQVRLRSYLALKYHEVGAVIHLSHTDALRNIPKEGAYISNMRNLAMFCASYNRTNFVGTYEVDIKKTEYDETRPQMLQK